MTAENLIFAYFVCLVAALSAVAIYYEMRRRRFEPAGAEDNIFRCTQCGTVYTDDADVDRSRCTQCGKMNESFKF